MSASISLRARAGGTTRTLAQSRALRYNFPTMPGQFGLWDYLKAAFHNRWNVMALLSGTVLSLFSGHLDIALPLVAAAELLYLGSAVTNPRYQRLIDSKLNAAERERTSADMLQRFNQLLYGLDQDSREMFQKLRARCNCLAPGSAGGAGPGMDAVTEAHVEGINRLLWVYLKLLHTRRTLDRFLASIDDGELDRNEAEIRKRIAALPSQPAEEIAQKMRSSLEDTQATLAARKSNLKRAKDNFDYVEVELERISTKLTALSEMAMNRQDPAQITSSVDDVARSVESTEQAIGELQVFTGLTAEDSAAPPILSSPAALPLPSSGTSPQKFQNRNRMLDR